MLERLPTPWGLVRSGVAPDHPKIKSVTRVYEKIGRASTVPLVRQRRGRAATSRATSSLDRYDAVVYAVGAEVGRPLGVPGADLPGVAPATDFVGWYNGHPDHRDQSSTCRSSAPSSSATATSRSTSRACSRSRTTSCERPTSPTMRSHALRDSRDPPRHAPRPPRARAGRVHDARAARARRARARGRPRRRRPTSRSTIGSRAALDDGASPTTRRNMDLLRQFAARARDPRPARHDRPALPALAGRDRRRRPRRGGRRGRQRARRRRGRDARRAADRPHETGCRPASCSDRSATAAGRSRACRSTPRAAWSRTTRAASPGARREYVTGWIKRGPSGIIGTNKKCAHATVQRLAGRPRRGARAAAPPPRRPRPGSTSGGRGWSPPRTGRRSTRTSAASARRRGRPRVKLTRFAELLAVAGA